jgi:hypothetical protein
VHPALYTMNALSRLEVNACQLKRGIANLKSLRVDQVVRFNDEMFGLPQAGIEGEFRPSSNRFPQAVGRDF